MADMEANVDLNLEGMDLEELLKLTDLSQARQKLLEMLDSEQMTDEVKDSIRAMLGGNVPVFQSHGGVSGTFLALGLASLLFAIIFFFGYKLYKSIKEKEKKKEEKKKAKQQKKKK